jgi:protein-tyrosine phosphatase
MTQILRVAALVLTALGLSYTARSAVGDPRVERVDNTHVIVSWNDPVAVDVYLSNGPDAEIAKSQALSADNLDGRQMITVVGGKRPYFLLRDKADGSIARVSERVLPLERGSNFRDLGGYPAAAGKHTRWGLIYRSAATPLLSNHDVAYVGALGVRSMIDLRSTEERPLAPTRLAGHGIQYIAFDYSFKALPKTYFEVLTTLAPEFRAVFKELLSGGGAVSYNCTAGQDRTGIATALILSSLGVPRQVILQDYHLSTLYRHPENEMLPIDLSKHPGDPVAAYFAKALQDRPPQLYSAAGRSYLAEMLDQVDARFGSVDNYLAKALSVGPAEIARLRASYLE